MSIADKKIFLKIIILGDSGVGKTSLLNAYVNHFFANKYKPTIGVDFMSKTIKLKDREIVMQIWDTAGQERFHSLNKSFFRGADGCLLVFDVNNPLSFDHLNKWYDECLNQISIFHSDIYPFILIGNKIDLKNNTYITKKQAFKWCQTKGHIPYIETSTRLAHNIDNAFHSIAEKCLSLNQNTPIDFFENVNISSTNTHFCCHI